MRFWIWWHSRKRHGITGGYEIEPTMPGHERRAVMFCRCGSSWVT